MSDPNIPASDRDVGIGHNDPGTLPYQIAKTENLAGQVDDYLNDEYGEMRQTLQTFVDRFNEIPETIEDDDALGVASKLTKDIADFRNRVEATRVNEKEPYHRAGQAVDNFFVPMREKVGRQDRKQKPGLRDVIQHRIDAYMQRKLEAERAARRAEEERLAREAEERRRAEEAARRAAEEAAAAAERARKAETKAAKEAAAEEAARLAAAAEAEKRIAEAAAEDAKINAMAKPADMVRTRVAEGPTVTMAREPYAVVTDAALLDKNALWPFISLAEKEKALRAWARNNGHTATMPGASVGFRQKSVVR